MPQLVRGPRAYKHPRGYKSPGLVGRGTSVDARVRRGSSQQRFAVGCLLELAEPTRPGSNEPHMMTSTGLGGALATESRPNNGYYE